MHAGTIACIYLRLFDLRFQVVYDSDIVLYIVSFALDCLCVFLCICLSLVCVCAYMLVCLCFQEASITVTPSEIRQVE